MEHFRSQSCRDGGRDMEMESYNSGGGRQVVPTSMQDLRSYSTNHVSNYANQPPPAAVNFKKSKKNVSAAKSWSFKDPEIQRKKRVAGYKVYTVEGKVKGSFRKSFRWIKDIVYGGWK